MMSLSAAAFSLLALHLAAAGLAAAQGRRRPAPPSARPFVCLLRPVCGQDRFDRETLASSFGLDWPDYEIVFCAAREEDAAVPLVRELIRLHPGARARLLIGEERITANPKLNNLAKGWAASPARMIAIADANLLLPRDYLEQLASEWRPGVALVSSPPAGGRAEGLWGALEAGFLNGLQGRWQLAAARLGLGFAQGKTMYLDRALLDRQGGLAALGGELAEDVAATRLVRAAGGRCGSCRGPSPSPSGGGGCATSGRGNCAGRASGGRVSPPSSRSSPCSRRCCRSSCSPLRRRSRSRSSSRSGMAARRFSAARWAGPRDGATSRPGCCAT